MPRELTSVRRALELLTLFRDAGAGCRVSDVARSLDVSKSTASRLLATLREAGFLVVDADNGRYHVGPVAFAVGSHFSGARLAQAVQRVVRDLAARTGSTTQFGMLRGRHVVFLAVHQGRLPVQVVARPGDVQYLHASAMGKAILGALPEPEQDRLIATVTDGHGRLPVVGPRTIIDVAALRADLAEAAARGYSVSHEESTAGMVGVGAYVASAGGIRTALSVAFAVHQHQGEEFAEVARAVTEAAAAAARILTPQRATERA